MPIEPIVKSDFPGAQLRRVMQNEELPDPYPEDTDQLEAFIDALNRTRIEYTEMLGELGHTERLVGARGVTAVLLDYMAAAHRLFKDDRKPTQIDRIREYLLDCIISATIAINLIDAGNLTGE